MNSPSEVTTLFFGALTRGDFAAAAVLLEPTELVTLRETELARLVGWARQHDAMKQVRDTPGPSMHGFSVEETVDAAALEKFRDYELNRHAGVRTLGDLTAQTPTEFAATYLRVTSGALGGGQLVPPITRRVVGEIIEDETRAYVVYRTTGSIFDDGPSEHARVLAFRRVAAEWRVELSSLAESPMGHQMFAISVIRR